MSTTLQELISKLSDVDPDLRFMALKDLQTISSNPESRDLYSDSSVTQIATKVLRRLGDNISEVQNEAIKWYVSDLKNLTSSIDTLTL